MEKSESNIIKALHSSSSSSFLNDYILYGSNLDLNQLDLVNQNDTRQAKDSNNVPSSSSSSPSKNTLQHSLTTITTSSSLESSSSSPQTQTPAPIPKRQVPNRGLPPVPNSSRNKSMMISSSPAVPTTSSKLARSGSTPKSGKHSRSDRHQHNKALGASVNIEKYQTIYQNYHKHAFGIDFQTQFKLTKSFSSIPEEIRAAPPTNEGELYYFIFHNGRQRGSPNDALWMVLREYYLFIHTSADDTEPVDYIDLRQTRLIVHLKKIERAVDQRYSYGLKLISCQADITTHFLWSMDPKLIIMWTIAIGHHTSNFTLDQEMDIINKILEVSQPVSLNGSGSYSKHVEDKVVDNKTKYTVTMEDDNPSISIAHKDTHSQSFFDELFDPQRKTYKMIARNLESPDDVNRLVKYALNQRGDLSKQFVEHVEIINYHVTYQMEKEKEKETLRKMIKDVILELTQTICHKLPDVTLTDKTGLTVQYAVERALFNHLHPAIYGHYIQQYAQEDEEHTAKVRQFLTLTPMHLSIPQKFWLIDDHPSGIDGSDELVPYQHAIDIMSKLYTYQSPSDKIQCLVDTSNAICEDIRLFWRARKNRPDLTLGADDLLPLFTFVIIKSKIPHMYTESIYLQDFLDDSLSTKIQGYFLVTFQTCLSLLCAWDLDELLQNASQNYDNIINTSASSSSSSLLLNTSTNSNNSTPSSSPNDNDLSISGIDASGEEWCILSSSH
ncbi:hypothetical protein SAMD00019534_028620 [Acytostelium subglobosum LB1]|uniref:hypothetical protein n=1 Tax=Acytostelium subglobosum LB1 TaxID=1410327 RepID=UPI0006447DF6|nr:hypothetical protein SAMD00019534_028620 [Acytostelium subglobosum LB1]GAM19687.1 hypothetical protein SAMD00019534_028620 [Acytostelium subglobosum LB1]|eukprot:XP_012756449.1 hypothetical protein SAMD00019534_028620 [Acytostelium subglobosum LB1]